MNMKRLFLFTSLLLMGCQTSDNLDRQFYDFSLNEDLNANVQMEEENYEQSDDEGDLKESNLWAAIASEMEMKVPENKRIEAEKIKFLKHKHYLHDIMLRAEPYMYWIVEKIRERKMPMELVLLPIVESAFDPKVTSVANAAGIWQIMPKTGKSYGLKQNQWYDGRRDIAASTDMALELMERLNVYFKGDWLLTLAAYNSGEPRVLQAIKRNKREGKPTDFWHLSLPAQTALYVPKVLAIGEILKNHQKYGVRLPTPDENRALARVEMGQQVKLAKVAKMAGLPLASFKTFNTGYKGETTAPDGPHYVMVPKVNAEQLRNSLASLDTVL